MFRLSGIWLGFITLLVVTDVSAEPPMFRLQVLPTAGESVLTAINNLGVATGYATEEATGRTQPFLFDSVSGAMTFLDLPTNSSGTVRDINDSGAVVGQLRELGEQATHSFVFDGTDFHFLDSPGLGFESPAARSMNALGQVAGRVFETGGGASHGFIKDGSAYEIFAGFGDSTTVHSINDSGVVVGSSIQSDSSLNRPFKYENGVLEDLIGPADPQSQGDARDINESGLVVGHYQEGNSEILKAASFLGGQVRLLGTIADPGVAPVSIAEAVNDAGQIVGQAFRDQELDPHGFVYLHDHMFDLNDYIEDANGFTVQNALDINNQGQIVGIGLTSGFEQRAFLLTPVPEPSTAALGLVAIVATAALRQFRQRKALSI